MKGEWLRDCSTLRRGMHSTPFGGSTWVYTNHNSGEMPRVTAVWVSTQFPVVLGEHNGRPARGEFLTAVLGEHSSGTGNSF